MQEISDLITAGGSPLLLGRIWTREVRHQISKLCEDTVAQAGRDGMEEGPAVVETILGLYAHGFFVGRDHALSGLMLPASVRRGLAGLSTENLGNIVIPNDISSL